MDLWCWRTTAAPPAEAEIPDQEGALHLYCPGKLSLQFPFVVVPIKRLHQCLVSLWWDRTSCSTPGPGAAWTTVWLNSDAVYCGVHGTAMKWLMFESFQMKNLLSVAVSSAPAAVNFPLQSLLNEQLKNTVLLFLPTYLKLLILWVLLVGKVTIRQKVHQWN